MGDVNYPAIFVTRANPGVKEADIVQHVKKLIKGSENFVDGEPSATIVVRLPECTKFSISGIKLSYNEIRTLLEQNMFCGYQFHISRPDFGCPRDDKDGLIAEGPNWDLQRRLELGQGNLAVLDIFMPAFATQFGNLADLSRIIYYDDVKRNIKVHALKKPGFNIQFGQVPGRMDSAKQYQSRPEYNMKKDNYEHGVTEIKYRYVCEALQAITLFNNTANLSNNKRCFITSTEGRKCSLPGKQGLRLGDERLFTIQIMQDYGYLPLGCLNRNIFDYDRIQKLSSHCFKCVQPYEILGVGPDLNWFAVSCGCTLSSFAWNNEPFFRMFVPYKDRILYNSSSTTRKKMEKLTRGLLVSYESSNEFQSTAIAAHLAEQFSSVEELHGQQTIGYLTYHETIETRVVKRQEKTRTLMIFIVQRSAYWCADGLMKMRMAYIKEIEDPLQRDEHLNYPESKECIKAEVSKIVNLIGNDNECLVMLTADMCPTAIVFSGMHFKIVPRPPKSVNNAIENAVQIWKKYELETGHYQEKTSVCITKYRLIPVTRPLGMWQLKLLMSTQLKLWNALDSAIDLCYVGCELKFKVHNKVLNSHQLVTVTGRITKIDCNIDKEVVVQLYIMMDKKLEPTKDTEASLKLWIVYSPAKQEDTLRCVPAGSEHEIDSGTEELLQRLIEDELEADVDDQLDDGSNMDNHGSINISAFPDAIKNLMLDDDSSIKLYLNQKFQTPVPKTNHQVVAANWKERPVVRNRLLDFVMHPSNSRRDFDVLVHNLPQSRLDEDKFNEIALTLDKHQLKSVMKMISSILHATNGPPGCGKTQTGTKGAALLSLTQNGLIIYCAPNNEGVDTAYETMKVINNSFNLKLNIVRMQSYARERQQEFNDDPTQLHKLITSHKLWRSCEETTKLIDKSESVIREKLTSEETKTLQKHYMRVASQIVAATDILFCTTACAIDNRVELFMKKLHTTQRDLSAIIIDDGSLLSLPILVSLFTLNPKRAWIIGDEKQLSMTVKSRTALNACLDISYMQLMQLHNCVKQNNMFSQLKINYRLPTASAKFISDYAYEGELISSEEFVQKRTYKDDVIVRNFQEVGRVNSVFYSYAGPAETLKDKSFYNETEVAIILNTLQRLEAIEFDMKNVCVLSMYKQQCSLLKRTLSSNGLDMVTVSTLDGFQGKQRDIVILSLVRSGDGNLAGFLGDRKRINVAFSRHVNFLFVVADVKFIAKCTEYALQDLIWLQSETRVVEYNVTKNGSVIIGSTDILSNYIKK